MGMELPNIPCQVVARTDVSRMISTDFHCSGNVETNLEITEVERLGGKIGISLRVKTCLRNSAPRNMKAKGNVLESKMFSVPLPLLRADDETPED